MGKSLHITESDAESWTQQRLSGTKIVSILAGKLLCIARAKYWILISEECIQPWGSYIAGKFLLVTKVDKDLNLLEYIQH